MKSSKRILLVGALVLIELIALVSVFSTLGEVDRVLTISRELDNALVSDIIVPTAILYLTIRIFILLFVIFAVAVHIRKIYIIETLERKIDKSFEELLDAFNKEKDDNTPGCEPFDEVTDNCRQSFKERAEAQEKELSEEEKLEAIRAKQDGYPKVTDSDFEERVKLIAMTLPPITGGYLSSMLTIFKEQVEEPVSVPTFIKTCLNKNIPLGIVNKYIFLFFSAEALVDNVRVRRV